MTARALAFTESPPGISTAASRVRRGSEIITGITDIALVSTNVSTPDNVLTDIGYDKCAIYEAL